MSGALIVSSLPGLRADVRQGDLWSSDAAPLVAQALLRGVRPPSPDAPLPSAGRLRAVAAAWGRFPGSFVGPEAAPLGRLAAASVADEVALARLAAPLAAAALFATPRASRRAALLAVPERARAYVMRAFEVERAAPSLDDASRAVASDVLPVAADTRAWAVGLMGRVVGDIWLDELRVIGRWQHLPERLPDRTLAEREPLVVWWVSRVAPQPEEKRELDTGRRE